MFSRVLSCLLAIFCVLFCSCSTDPTGPDTEEESYVLQDGVELIEISDLLDIRVLRHELVGVPPKYELWIKKAYKDSPDLQPFKVGDVLYCTPTKQVPSVVFLKVTKWTTSQRERDYYLVETAPADLIDVFQEASIHKRIPLDLDEGDFELPDETVKLLDAGNLSLGLENTDLDVSCSGGGASNVQIERGVVEVIDAVLKLDIEIENSRLMEFSAVTASRSKVDCDLSVDLNLYQSCEFTKEIFKKEKRSVIQAGPVPVLVEYTFSIDIGFSIGGSIEVKVALKEYKADVSTTAGVTYRNETGAPCVPEKECYEPILGQTINSWSAATDPLVEAEAAAEFKVFVQEKLGVMFYEVIGPEIWMKQWVGPEGTFPSQECSWLQAFVEVKAGLDVGGGLSCKLLDNVMGSVQIEFTPLEKVLWSGCVGF